MTKTRHTSQAPVLAHRPEWRATLAHRGAEFYGHGAATGEARRELGLIAAAAWDEERSDRSQAAWRGLEDILRGE